MVMSIYRKALAVILKKPFQLWGISILSSVLTGVVLFLFGTVIGVSLAINLAISTSMTIIFLRGYRGEVPHAADLFICLKDGATAMRVIGGMAWMILWIFIWSLIPIVGPIFAIVKAYSFRLTPYILVQEPNVPATEAIKVSAERTKGFRLSMFLAEFLAVIVIYVALFIIGFILGLLALIPFIGVIFGLVLAIIVIAVIVLLPLFLGLVQAAFYEEIMAKNNQ